MLPQCNASLLLSGENATAVESPLWANSDWTFHKLGLWIAAGFGGLATLIALFLIAMHATHYTNPPQQRQIIRILFMIPIYACISFLSYLFYNYYLYWEVIRDCYEAFAIASFFALLCFYIAPTLKDQKQYFREQTPYNWVLPINWFQGCTGGKDRGFLRIPRSGLTWFNIIYIGVFQYCFIRVLLTFASLISELTNRYCDSSLSPAFAHIWVLTFDAVAVTIAMYCLIQFYIQTRHDLKEHKPFLKVLCIKLVIFFSFWQNTLISFLSSGTHAVITTGPRVSYVDVKIGIPNVLLCVEMAIFSVLHIFAFSHKPYANEKNQGGFLGIKALIDAFSPMDFIRATARGFRWLFVGIRYRTQDTSYDDKLGRASSGITAGSAGSRLGKTHAEDDEFGSSDTGYSGYKTQSVGGVYGAGAAGASGSAYEMSVRPPGRTGTNDDSNSDKLALLAHQQGMPSDAHIPLSGASTPRASQQMQQGAYALSPALRPYQPPSAGPPPNATNWPLAAPVHGDELFLDQPQARIRPQQQDLHMGSPPRQQQMSQQQQPWQQQQQQQQQQGSPQRQQGDGHGFDGPHRF